MCNNNRPPRATDIVAEELFILDFTIYFFSDALPDTPTTEVGIRHARGASTARGGIALGWS